MSGVVDDAMEVGTGSTPVKQIGFANCSPDSFAMVNVTSNVNSRGETQIVLYDKTVSSSNNRVSLTGTCELTFGIDESLIPDVSDQNSEDEGWEEGYTDPGDGQERIPALPGPGRLKKKCPEGDDLWNPSEQQVGCERCGIRGQPQTWVDEATLNVKVRDVPVWTETPVGEPLELRLRFSNFASLSRGNGAQRPFGPQWSSQWESLVSVEATNTGRVWVWMPSGSEILFTNTVYLGTNYYPPASVGGRLVWLVSSSRFEYRGEGGQTWTYSNYPWISNRDFLLTEMKDEWGNSVKLSYLSNRLHHIEQNIPNTGMRLEFEYEGTGMLARAVSAVGRNGNRRTANFGYMDFLPWSAPPIRMLASVMDMAGYETIYFYQDARYLTQVGDVGVKYSSSPSEWTTTNAFWVETSGDDGRGGKWQTRHQWLYDNANPTNYEPTHVIKTTTRSNATAESVAERIGLFRTGSSGRGWKIASRYNLAMTNRIELIACDPTNGYVSAHYDMGGNSWIYRYDALRRVTQTVNAAGAQWNYFYSGNERNLAYVKMPDGTIPRRFVYLAGRHEVATVSNATGQVTSYQYNSRGQITNAYDGRMNLTFLYDTNGFLLEKRRDGILLEEYGYDDFGNHVWTRDAAGLETTLTLDGLDRPVRRDLSVADPNNAERWSYGCCFPSGYWDRRSNYWSFVRNPLGELLEQWDYGQVGDWFRQANGVHGKPAVVSNDYQTSIRQYNVFGYLTNVAGEVFAADAVREGAYWPDGLGRTTQYTSRAGASWQIKYDAVGNRTSVQVFPASSNVGGQTQAILVESNRYNTNGWVVWSRDINGLEVSNRYNAMGWLTNRLYPDGTSMRWTYTPWGELASAMDRDGHVVSNRYDSCGRLVERVDARTNSTRYAYDNSDRVAAITNALGQDWHFQYDMEGNLKEILYPDASRDAFEYSGGMLVEKIQNAGTPGAMTNGYYRDSAGRIRWLYRGGEVIQSMTYTPLNLPDVLVDAEGEAVSHGWDDRGRLLSRTWPDASSETLQYDWLGATNFIDRFGIPARMQPDRLGRLLRRTDGNTNTIRRTYATNSLWRLAEIFDAKSNRTSWAYDRYGNPTNKTYANNSSEPVQYNRQNQPVRRVSPGGIVSSNAYDANGNLTFVWRGQESVVALAYDPLNRCTQMVDAVGTTRWTYDARGRVTGEANPWDAPSASLRYDGAGRMTQLVFGAWSMALSYDALGRVHALTAPEGAYSFGHYLNGIRRTWQSGPNGVHETRQYGNGLTNLVISNAAVRLLRLACGRGTAERMTSQAHYPGTSASADRSSTLAYDRAGQWTNSAAVPATRSETWSYDPAGNPLGKTRLGISRQAAYDNLNQITNLSCAGQAATVLGGVRGGAANLSRIVTVNGQTATLSGGEYALTNLSVTAGTTNPVEVVYNAYYTNNVPLTASAFSTLDLRAAAFAHDAEGNLTSDGLRTCQYDAAGRLTNVVEIAGGARLLSLRYDGLGRRVEAWRQNGQIERYVYVPGTFLVLAVLDETNGVKEILTRGPDLSGTLDGAGGIGGLLATTSGTNTHYLHSDGLGNVILVTDGSGNNVAEYEYTPFGEELSRSGTYDSRFRFSTKERDPETGFYDFGYRVYAPSLGRWLSRDPLGESADPLHNLYRFVGNNPLNAVDPLGLWGIQFGDNGRNFGIGSPTLIFTARDASDAYGSIMSSGVDWAFGADGRFSEAAQNFRTGGHAPINVNPNALNFSQLTPDMKYYTFPFSSRGDFIVHGSVSLTRSQDGIGRDVGDEFNFDVGASSRHPWVGQGHQIMRNIETLGSHFVVDPIDLFTDPSGAGNGSAGQSGNGGFYFHFTQSLTAQQPGQSFPYSRAPCYP